MNATCSAAKKPRQYNMVINPNDQDKQSQSNQQHHITTVHIKDGKATLIEGINAEFSTM
jgi:hypothetical protein